MGKLYVRVDDRLIHGQTIVAWCPTLGIQEIIAVDDVSAANPMLKSILTMGVPKNYKTGIVTTQEAKKLLGEGSDKTRLLIVKFPQKLEELRQELHQTNQALRNAYDKFNFVTAPELVEASIYEINALKARSDYLLRCIKAQLGQEPCAAAAAMKGGTACPS